MPQTIFITGVSSGLGLALAESFLSKGARVFGLSRRAPPGIIGNPDFHFVSLDLSDFAAIPHAAARLLSGVDHVDLAILNAGVLGEIGDMAEASLEKMKHVMDVNVWSNKPLLDVLMARRVDQVVAVSSGAGINGARGWNGYAISKAALNMFIKLYAAERPQTHFSAFAPGLVDTDMQAYMRTLPADERFPTVDHLKKAHGSPDMPSSAEAAPRLIEAMEALLGCKSGEFHDVRNLI
jgi:benzil reductase ((S)-benzoin forming)